jgi:hypothetical protein
MGVGSRQPLSPISIVPIRPNAMLPRDLGLHRVSTPPMLVGAADRDRKPPQIGFLVVAIW